MLLLGALVASSPPVGSGLFRTRFRNIPLVLRLMFFFPSGLRVEEQVRQVLEGSVKQLMAGNAPVKIGFPQYSAPSI